MGKGKTVHTVLGVEKLDGLDAEFRKKAKKVVDAMQAKGWKLKILWGKRTKEENDKLVEAGTASKTSKHLSGKAVDLINRLDPYPADKNHQYYKDMKEAVKAAELTWGGDFKSRWDPTHFEVK